MGRVTVGLASLKIGAFGGETFGSDPDGDIILEGDEIVFSSGIFGD